MAFNFRQFKKAQQWGHYPPESLPDSNDRWWRLRKDPYRSKQKPSDGEGQKLTTPWSVGMPGDPPDAGAGWGGGNERKGYPKGISQFEDSQDKGSVEREDIPIDRDPDDPMTGKGREEGNTEYGKGLATDMGQALHDDGNIYGQPEESILGTKRTTLDALDDNLRDRKPDISNMQQPSDNPFNKRRRGKGALDVARYELNNR